MMEELAKQLLEAGSPEAERAFREALLGISDPAKLRPLAERFFADPEVSVPTFERLVELSPEDPAAHVDLGFVFFLMGEDVAANQQLTKARALDPEHVQVLALQAALEHDPKEKVQLYRRILQKDPDNEVARGKLRELGVT